MAEQAHTLVVGGFLEYRYEPPELDSYVQEVDQLLMHGDRDALRDKYLTPEQREQVKAYRAL